MKFLKILFFGFLGLVAVIAGLATYGHFKVQWNDPHYAELRLLDQYWIERNYFVYVLADPNDTTPPEQIGKQLQYICRTKGGNKCGIGVWKEERFAPKDMPMTDQEVGWKFLAYDRNTNTKFEQLLEMRDGKNTEIRLPRSF